jgi:hypothetical protein
MAKLIQESRKVPVLAENFDHHPRSDREYQNCKRGLQGLFRGVFSQYEAEAEARHCNGDDSAKKAPLDRFAELSRESSQGLKADHEKGSRYCPFKVDPQQ